MGVRIESPELVGRDAELATVEQWLDRLHSGPSVLAVIGEPGIGKTTLWSTAIRAAEERGARVLVARPVEGELALGYAALGDLLQGVADEVLPVLPAPQAQALSTALSLENHPGAGDPLLVGRATLAALRSLAAGASVVVAVDDVQWLDSSSARALAFAARRLNDAPVAFVTTRREGHDDALQLAAAIAASSVEIRLTGLSLGATGHLLRERIGPAIPRRRLLRIHKRSAGNPFYALQLAGVEADDDSLPPSLGEAVHRHLLSAHGGQAAIELVAVRGPLPIRVFPDPAALDAAVGAGVLAERDGQVRFAHPLLAAGAHDRIPPARRRELHRAAAVSAGSVEQRARHLALAADGPDPATAAVLDQAALSARRRGAPEAAAELMRHARALTPADDDASRARRTMDEAEFLMLAGDEVGARTLVDRLVETDVTGLLRVRALFVRALTTSDPIEAVGSLEAAVAEPHDDRALAARTLAQLAWQRGAWLGDVGAAVDEALAAVALAEALDDPAILVSALTTAGLVLSLGNQPGAAGHFERALQITDRVPIAVGDRMPRVAYGIERAWRGDYARAESLLAEARVAAEEQGNEYVLMRLTLFGADLAVRRGRWDEAAEMLETAVVDSAEYWRASALVQRAILRARRGDPAALNDADEVRRSGTAQTDPLMSAAADFAIGLLDHAGGRTAEAADRVARLASPVALAGVRSAEHAFTFPEIVAILVEAGRLEQAEALANGLRARANQLAPWSDAAAALCLGLVAHAAGRLEDAQAHLTEARQAFDRLGARWELGQALLAEGSLLRRLGRRRDAAERLDQALAIFEQLGAKPAAARVREELRRARPRRRAHDRLTAAESRVAALVAEGLTNREIAERQFTTVATVEAHLTRIYSKLGIRSRTDLARRVSDGSLVLDADG